MEWGEWRRWLGLFLGKTKRNSPNSPIAQREWQLIQNSEW